MYIRQLHIKNYRSLRDVKIGDLSPIVVLYGENDSGKSNILSFLEHIFAQKYEVDLTEVAGGDSLAQRRSSGFWRGEIDDFSDNFYRNGNEPITFTITIQFDRSEICSIPALPKQFLDKLSSRRKYDLLKIEGQIERLSSTNRARISLLKAEFNQKPFYDAEAPENSRYLPDFNLDPGQSLDVFNNIMSKLDNAFLKISNDRFLTNEKESERSREAYLTPRSFKNWLFQSSVSRDTEELFRQISKQFDSDPFGYGRVSIARVGEDEIEVFVKDKHGLKLPIGRKGTGVQQMLIILSFIAKFSSPFVGIEELEINLSPKSQVIIFDTLHELVYHTEGSPIKQIFLTTHSPHIARRREAECRGVWMNENRETQVAKPSEAEVDEFFRYPFFIFVDNSN